MNDTRIKLEALLLKKDWNDEERQWMLDYLNSGDVTMLQQICRYQYEDDLEKVEQIIDKKLSRNILKKIYRKTDGKRKRRRVYRFSGGAAGIILLLFISVYFFRDRPVMQAGSSNEMVVETKPGQERTLVLGDGTEVWLGPGSQLKYPDKFAGKEREVELSGEAFFTVAENATEPFIVRTASLNTRILGTSFDVVAYKDRNYSTVTVATGKVSVTIGNKSTGLLSPMEVLPNQRVTFKDGDYKLVKEDFPNADIVLKDRRNGHMKYKGVPLSTVVEDLRVEYGAKIKIDPEMEECAYYGDLDVNEGLEVSLKVLCLTFNANLQKDGDVYIINGKGS